MQPIILLTAAISPENVNSLKLTNSDVRYEQYIQSLRFYSSIKNCKKIIFCEGTGFDSSEIKKLFPSVEFLTTDVRKYVTEYGKGYGEMELIRYALINSKMIEDNSLIIKITGRLKVLNISKILHLFSRDKEVEIFSDIKGNLTYSDSRIYAMSYRVTEDFLFNHQPINERIGIDFEIVLCRYILSNLDSIKWRVLPCEPDILGYSGTTGRAYRAGFIQKFLKNIRRIFIKRVYSNY